MTKTNKARLTLLLALAFWGSPSQGQREQKATQREQSSFSMEQEIVPIEKPVELPERAVQAPEKDADVSSCMENANVHPGQLPSSWFVGSLVHLDGPGEIAFVVLRSPLKATEPMHPAPNACFLGPYTAKFWVLRVTGGNYELALTVQTHGLEVLEAKWKGYRDIRTTASSLNGSTSTLYEFDGQRYKVSGEKS